MTSSGGSLDKLRLAIGDMMKLGKTSSSKKLTKLKLKKPSLNLKMK